MFISGDKICEITFQMTAEKTAEIRVEALALC